MIERIEVDEKKIRVKLKTPCLVSELDTSDQRSRYIDIHRLQTLKGTLVHIGESAKRGDEPDTALIQALASAHRWTRLLMKGKHTSIESLADFINMHPKVIRKGIRLAFVAPEITKAIVLGQQPSTLRLTSLHEAAAPLSWAE